MRKIKPFAFIVLLIAIVCSEGAINSSKANPTDVRGATNLEIARRIVADLRKREESESTVGGIVDAVVDFGAMILRESTIGIPENLGGRTRTKGVEIVLKRFQMSPKEFKAWFNDYAESVYEEGLGSGNAWQIDQLEEELEGVGNDRLDTFKAVGSIIWLLTLIVSAYTFNIGVRLKRWLNSSRSVIKRLTRFSMFGGMKYRADVSVYWHQQTGISRNDMARITEINRDILNEFKIEGLDSHDAGVRLSIVLFSQYLQARSIDNAMSVLNMIYGKEYVPSVVKLANHGMDYLMMEHFSHLKNGIIASCYNESEWMQDYLEKMEESGNLDKHFSALLKESKSFLLNDELHKLVNDLPSWARAAG